MNQISKKIVVTGASGFLGGHVINYLSKHTNSQIIASIMPLERATYKALPTIQIITNDMLFDGKVSDIDCVINCAFARSNNAADLASGIDFTTQLIKGLELCRPSLVINISSQGVYQRLSKGMLSTETSPIEPIDLYSMAKYTVEKMFLVSTLPHVTNVRLASLNMKQRFLYKFVEATKENKPIALNSPHVMASLLDVNDAAEGLAQLTYLNPNNVRQIYNLGTGSQISLAEWANNVQKIGLQLGYNARIEINDNGNTATAGMDISLLEKDTGWKPKTTIEEMITKMFTW